MFSPWMIVSAAVVVLSGSTLIGAQETDKEKPQKTETVKKEKPQDSMTLIFTNKGHTTTAKNPQKWPYPPQGESGKTSVPFTSSELAGVLLNGAKLESGAKWAAPAEAANKFLRNLERGADSLTGTLNFTAKEQAGEAWTVEVTGTVAIRATEGGGKGKRYIDAELKGTIKVGAGNQITEVAILGENIKVVGTWDAGQWGIQELTGEGKIVIETKGATSTTKKGKTEKDPEDNGNNMGPGNSGQGDWEVTSFEPIVGISVASWQKTLSLNEDQVDQLRELMKEGWGKWGTGAGVPKLRKWIGEELKKELSDDQKAKVDELLKKSSGASFGPPDSGQNFGPPSQKNENRKEIKEQKQNKDIENKKEQQENNQNP